MLAYWTCPLSWVIWETTSRILLRIEMLHHIDTTHLLCTYGSVIGKIYENEVTTRSLCMINETKYMPLEQDHDY